MSEILIANTKVRIKEYNGQRVVTFKDIDTIHNRAEGTARKRFNDNRKHFIEGVDYFNIQMSEKRTLEFEIPNRGLTLITESGYLLIVKSFTDDLSWTVQRELVNSYFREKRRELSNVQMTKQSLGYQYIDKTFLRIPILTVADICYFYNVNNFYLYSIIQKELSCETDYALLQGEALQQYLIENPNAPKCRKKLYVIYKTGFNKLLEHFNFEVNEIPKIMYQNKGKKFVVQDAAKNVMNYIRRDLKGIEALTYLIEGIDTPDNIENYRDILVTKLSMLGRWKMDASLVKLGIHPISIQELIKIQKNE